MSLQKRFEIHEDWTVVALGALIIIVSLVGLVLKVPVFNWANSTELFQNVLEPGNLSLIGYQFVFVLFIAILGAILTGKSVKNFALGFPIIYLITIFALILAGNSAVKSVNLEAVIFSLTLGLIIGNFFKLPEWLRSSLSTELFVKIGLVLLGTSVIFSDILKSRLFGPNSGPYCCSISLVFRILVM